MSNICFDSYQKIFKYNEIQDRIIIVDIDEPSLEKFGQFPWSRNIFSKILENINKSNPKAIGLDIFFSEKDKQSPEEIIKTEINKSELRLKKSSPPSVDVKLNFLDWIQFTQEKQTQTTLSKEADKAGPLSEKIHIIDRFLKANPKIPPGGKNESNNYSLEEDLYSNELMTETLAKVLVKQKKYKKAIGAYKILSLKYPEKNVFFADKIQEIRKLQQE